MEGPSFQTFEKEKIVNPLIPPVQTSGRNLSLNQSYHINKEDSNISNLIVNRTRDIMETHVFQIIHSSLTEKQINNIKLYLKHILKIDKEKELIIDTIGDFVDNDYKEDTLYIINTHNNNVLNQNITGTEITSLMLKSIFEKVGGLLFISKNIDEVPKFICTTSQLVFIQKDIENLETTLALSAGIRIKNNPVIDIDMICIDKFSLWTRICNFNKI
jgi:hypothetical protein